MTVFPISLYAVFAPLTPIFGTSRCGDSVPYAPCVGYRDDRIVEKCKIRSHPDDYPKPRIVAPRATVRT